MAQQRLIYKGRVLKDDQSLEHYDMQEGHLVHLVKSSERANRSEVDEPVSDIGEILEKVESEATLTRQQPRLPPRPSERRPPSPARPAGPEPGDDSAHHERPDDGHPAQQPGKNVS